MKDVNWEQRATRAEELAAKYSFARDILGFYTRVFGLQRILHAYAQEWLDAGPSLRGCDLFSVDLSVRPLLPRFQEFLAELESFAPPPIAQAARELLADENGASEHLLSTFLCDLLPIPTEPATVVAWLFLQPYIEKLAAHAHDLAPSTAPNLCPFCSGKPVVGVLRPEGDGAKRFLICWRCSTEWAYGRILCASCGEAAIDKLAVYTATQFEHVRVESCDTCRHYIKTVDLTRDGRAVPLVDELATVPLNLWANEHGYQKVQPNFLGL